jgi:hypothetical protein
LLLTREALLAGVRGSDVLAEALAAVEVPRPSADKRR